ncbi:MAG TPA: hypothetical protein DC047_03265 [Blastocatellia bacterium]|nr:hypothetical protein [Blastocatellia bacterium]
MTVKRWLVRQHDAAIAGRAFYNPPTVQFLSSYVGNFSLHTFAAVGFACLGALACTGITRSELKLMTLARD